VIKSETIRGAGNVEGMGDIRRAEKPEGKRPFRRSRYRWGDNIRMDIRDSGRRGVNWLHLAQNRDRCRDIVNTVMNLWDSVQSGEFLD
jgi:hypothetical protein